MKQAIKEALTTAMKAKDAAAVSALRLIMAKIKEKEINDRPQTNGAELDSVAIVGVLKQMLKQRQDSITEYQKANRLDLVAKEQAEIQVIMGFMPEQITGEALQQLIRKSVEVTGASGVKDLGKVIAHIKANHGDSVDMGEVSKVLKSIL